MPEVLDKGLGRLPQSVAVVRVAGVRVAVGVGVLVDGAARRAGVRVTPTPDAGTVVVPVHIPVHIPVRVAVHVAVHVAIGIAIHITVGIHVSVGVPIRVPVRIAIGIHVAVGIAVGIAIDITVHVAIGVVVGVIVGITVGVAVVVFAGSATRIEGLAAGVLVSVGRAATLLILPGAGLLALAAVALHARNRRIEERSAQRQRGEDGERQVSESLLHRCILL